MREHRTTLRFNETEAAIIRSFAEQNGITVSEGIRRLVFWQRLPNFSLPDPGSANDETINNKKDKRND